MKRLALMFAAASLAAPASAEAMQEEPRTMTVSVAGVRFDNPESVAGFRARLARAVRTVCAPDGTTLRELAASRQCRIQATERSERQLAQLIARTRLASASLGRIGQ